MAATAGESNGQPLADVAAIDFLHEFKDSYVRTRHNNLRCFPACGRVHRESSFCGRSVEIKVLKALVPNLRDAFVFGEFRRQTGPLSFTVGEGYLKSRLKSDANNIEQAEYVNMNEQYYRFVFTPNKKWRYDARIPRQQDVHVFTVYLVNDEVITNTLDSKGFVIIPVWKTDEFLLRAHSEDPDSGTQDEDDASEELEPKQPTVSEPRSEGAVGLSKNSSPPKRLVEEPIRSEKKSRRISSDSSEMQSIITNQTSVQTSRAPAIAPRHGVPRPQAVQVRPIHHSVPNRGLPVLPSTGFQGLPQNIGSLDPRQMISGIYNPGSPQQPPVFMSILGCPQYPSIMYNQQPHLSTFGPQSLRAQPMMMTLPHMLQGATPYLPTMTMPSLMFNPNGILPAPNTAGPSNGHIMQAQSSRGVPGSSKKLPSQGRPPH